MTDSVQPLPRRNTECQLPPSRRAVDIQQPLETLPLDDASYPTPLPTPSQIAVGAVALLAIRCAWLSAIHLVDVAQLVLTDHLSVVQKNDQTFRMIPMEELSVASKWSCFGSILLITIALIAHFSTVIHIRLTPRGISRACYAVILWQLGASLFLYWAISHDIYPISTLVIETGCGLLGLSLLAAGSRQFSRARQEMALDADRVLATDPRRAILYLRSFKQDIERAPDDLEAPTGTFRREDRTYLPGFWINRRHTTFEEWLCKSLGKIGPVVAIGKPGERLPPLGAARKYVPDLQWQPEVLRLFEVTRFTCLVLGSSPGLDWELQALRAKGPPHKLMLVLPQRQLLEPLRRDGLPLNALGILFTRDWHPVIATGRATARNYRKLAVIMERHATNSQTLSCR